MKAWILSDRTGEDNALSLVFANTISEAKEQLNIHSDYMYQNYIDIDNWIDISAKRAKEFDGFENADEREICIRLIMQDSWWFEIDGQRYSEENIEKFKLLKEVQE